MGGEIEEKYHEEEGVGKIMEDVVVSAEKLAFGSNQIYQEEGNKMESLILTIDQYLETVEIFVHSLGPEFEETNDVSINTMFHVTWFFPKYVLEKVKSSG